MGVLVKWEDFKDIDRLDSAVFPDSKKSNRFRDIVEAICYYADRRGLKKKEIAASVGMQPKYLSKIMHSTHYMPRRDTVIALAIGLGLNIEETIDFMQLAGYAFSPGLRRDRIVIRCIQLGYQEMVNVDMVLEHFGEISFSREENGN